MSNTSAMKSIMERAFHKHEYVFDHTIKVLSCECGKKLEVVEKEGKDGNKNLS